MAPKSQQLQIRIAPAEKRALKRLAKAAGVDLSTYVLARALPSDQLRFAEILTALRGSEDRRFVFAELNDFLESCAPVQFPDAVRQAGLAGLSPVLQNYVAAMVEQAAERKGLAPPAWVREIEPLHEPHFGTSLKSLRWHLLRSSPIPFKRRNIFVDSSVGARV